MERGLISVDRWSETSQAYFLTHLHADHTKGLSSKWSRGPLYCSPVSAKLFPSKFRGFDLSLLTVLEVGTTYSIPLVSRTTGSEVQILVTPIDAHHCPGAVMYLFRGEFGLMLYTGDFRWEWRSERAHLGKKMLFDALRGDKVDVLYLDNTYCHPSFSFPPREIAAEQVVDIINMHPNHEIIIGIDTLGKEDLLLHISKALNTKIWVWPERLETMHLLGFADIFTTRTCLTRVRAVPRYNLTIDTLQALNTLHPTIGIMPSGLPWGVKPFDKMDASLVSSFVVSYKSKGSANSRVQMDRNQIYSPRRVHPYAFAVPYSEHSCFSEIQEFVKFVQPSKLTGIVSSSFCYINPRHYLGHLCGANHLSDKTCGNIRSQIAERVEVMQTGSVRRCKKSNEPKEKEDGNGKVARLSVHRSRVSVLRRKKHGAKIVETDGICSSDLNVGIL